MKNFTTKKLVLAAATLLVSGMLVGCEEKGPAEKAGESLDKAGRNLKDAVDPRGPGEKIGGQIDKAVGNK
jgi:hypothetical protein